jgi:hypothetical protein
MFVRSLRVGTNNFISLRVGTNNFICSYFSARQYPWPGSSRVLLPEKGSHPAPAGDLERTRSASSSARISSARGVALAHSLRRSVDAHQRIIGTGCSRHRSSITSAIQQGGPRVLLSKKAPTPQCAGGRTDPVGPTPGAPQSVPPRAHDLEVKRRRPSSRRAERTRLLRLLSTQHHVANRGRVPLTAARRRDPTRVQGLGDLPQ